MARVVGLGHVGIYCWDLKEMTDFYQHFMGMQLTKQDWRRGMIFLSADPEKSDHEIALMAGRPEGERPHLILSDEEVMAIVDEQWGRLGHVQPGEALEPAMAVPA